MLVDDHAVLRAGIKTVVEMESDMRVVSSCPNAEEALAAGCEADVCVADLRLGDGMDGIDFIMRLQSAHGAQCPAVVVFSTFDTEEDVFRALDAGASGFLSKQAGADELVAAIRAAAAGEKTVPPGIADKLRRRADREPLSKRQLEILGYLASGLSNKEIGLKTFVCEDTVKSHLRTIYQRLGARDRVEAVRAAMSLGLVKP